MTDDPPNAFIVSLDNIDRRERYKLRHKAAGLCEDCPRPARPGKTRCGKCAAAHGKNDRRLAQYHRENHLCPFCGLPVEQGYICHNRNECVPSRRLSR